MRAPRLLSIVLLLVVGCGSSGGTPSPHDASTPPDNGDGDGDGDSDNGDGDNGDGDSGDGDNGDGDGDGDGGDGDTGDGDTGDGDGGDGDAPVNMRTFVYVGGWGTDYPFRAYQLDRDSGALSPVGEPVDLGASPAFIMPSRDGRFLYVANEVDGQQSGVTVARINQADGTIENIDHEGTGDAIVYTTVHPNGKYVLGSSYSQGNVSAFPINDDGSLDAAVDTLEVGGNAHAVVVDTTGKWAFVPNLAQNEVEQLAFDTGSGKLSFNATSAALSTGAGSGPRHMAIHPNGKHAYLMLEKTPRIDAYEIRQDGTLNEIDSQRTVPEGVSESAGAHVLIHPNGKFVYVSNRNHQSIAVFAIGDDGKLSFVEHEDTRGVHPRNFDIDPSGKFMVVANKDSGNLVVFGIGDDGRLSLLAEPVSDLSEPTGVAIVNLP